MENTYYKLATKNELPSLAEVRTYKNLRTLSFSLFTIFLAFILTLIYMPWLQTLPGAGKVIAYTPLERQQNIEATIEGRVRKWYVQEGSKVTKGQLIAEISDNDPQYVERLTQQRKFLEDTIKAARERSDAFSLLITTLEDSRRNAISAAELRVKMAHDRVIGSENQLFASEAAHQTALLNLERQEALDKKGLTSKRTLELAHLELKRTETEVSRAKAVLSASKKEAKALESDKEKIDKDGNASIANAKASYSSASAEIARATTELNRMDITVSRQMNQVIKAPRNGTILRLNVNQDTEMVRAGETLAVLIPDTNNRAVELFVSGNDVPLVAKSSNVRLQFEGWPALQFNGWPSVSVGTFGGKVSFIDAVDNGKGKFRVVILPDGKQPWPEIKYLRQGVRANGWIIVNQVPLWYELWRQFNGFPPVINIEDNEKKDATNVIKRKEKKD